ncbi:MAG: TatD family deoxyribonuclease [Bacteroidetes bacterium]|nr:MAG: TatD family deoxyribonuclease [Bacteroidota bacterium]
MKLIDTHTHLYLEQFDEDRNEVLQRAFDAGVEALYLPNVDSRTIDGMLEMEKQWPGRCFPMMGVHPCSIGENYEEELRIAREWLDTRSFVAIGEIGIDLYWDKTYFEEQKIAFSTQMDWALEFDVPIVIHSRDSTDEIIELMRSRADRLPRGIFHCFTGNLEQANAIIDLGFMLGIGGVVTFKNGGLDKTIVDVDLENLVLETDAPYLTPAPFRGKRNESSYVRLVAEKLAAVKGITLEEVAKVTTDNAGKLFA